MMRNKLVAKSRIFNIYQKGQFEYAMLFNNTIDAVMVAALTDKKELIFVEQYLQAMNKKGLVFPGGRVDPGEKIEEAAVRELAEETNFLAGEIKKTGILDILPKYLCGQTHLFLATKLRKTDQFKGDEGGDIKLVFIPLDQVEQKIMQSAITDSRTVALALIVSRLLDGD